MELFKNVTPRTAENFRQLCTGQAGLSKISGKPLTYKGSIFHRVIKGFMMQGGDFTNKNGTGGESIYGMKFPDENFKLRHTLKGLLSMANAGKNTNGSQFFLTFAPANWLDGKHCVFGRVESGYEIAARIEKIPVNVNDKPSMSVVVKDCGEIKPAPKVEVPKPVPTVAAAPVSVVGAGEAPKATEEVKEGDKSVAVSATPVGESAGHVAPKRSRSRSGSSSRSDRSGSKDKHHHSSTDKKSKKIKKHHKKQHKRHRQ